MDLSDVKVPVQEWIGKSIYKLTLGSFPNPLSGHSLTLRGVEMQHILAWWIHGSLMILTVNPFVALMFLTVSLSPDGVCMLEKDMMGGELDTCECDRINIFKIRNDRGISTSLKKLSMT